MTDYLVISRSVDIATPADEISPRIVDFHRWVDWSPWEDLDPDMSRTYSGPTHGVGARYEWAGNRKAGAGSMTITDVTSEHIAIDLDFTRPFKSASKCRFLLSGSGEETTVTWEVHTPKTLMTRIAGIFVKFDKTVGADLDKGLASLKGIVEAA